MVAIVVVNEDSLRTGAYTAEGATGTRLAAPQPTTPRTAAASRPSPVTTPRVEPAAETTAAATNTVELEVTAARGDCWLEVYEGSPQGERLYFGILAQGKTVRFVQRRIIVRAGAGENVNLRLDGRVADALPAGVTAVMVSRDGVAPAPAS